MRLTLLLLLFPLIGQAQQEGPCHDDGDWVMCERPGFDKLLAKCKDYRGRAEKCEIELDETKKYALYLEASVKDCHEPCPTCGQPLPPKVQTGQRQAWGYLLGVLGTTAVMAAPLFPQMGMQAQVATVAGGLVALGTGFVLNLTFD